MAVKAALADLLKGAERVERTYINKKGGRSRLKG